MALCFNDYAKIENLNIRYENDNENFISLDFYIINIILFDVNKFNHIIHNRLRDLKSLLPLERIHTAKRERKMVNLTE